MKESKEIRSLTTYAEMITSAVDVGEEEHLDSTLSVVSSSCAYIDFAQKMKAINYREARELKSATSAERSTKKEYIKKIRKASEGKIQGINVEAREVEGTFKVFPFPTKNAGLYGSIEHFHKDEREELVDLQFELHAEDPELVKAIEGVIDSVKKRHELSHIKGAILEWSKKRLQEGVLLTNLKNYIFRKQNEAKSQYAYFQPPTIHSIATEIKNEVESGDDLGLTVGEFEALLFLLWKAFNMDEREQYIKESWIDKYKASKDEIVCVFRASTALKSAFGDNIKFNDKHYDRLNKSLTSLYEKKRKIVLQRGNETVEVKMRLIEQLELRHKLNEGEEFTDYIVCSIPRGIVDLPQEQYTKINHNLMSKIRTTPPETRTNAPLVKFILFLIVEQSYQQKRVRSVRRKKDKLMSVLFGEDEAARKNFTRNTTMLESKYVEKAKNMKILDSFCVEMNRQGEEVYVFDLSPFEVLEIEDS